jgi:glycosyltransferase involved in cell wall biosynthesis
VGCKLRLCIFTNHFYPENFKVNDIAFELSKRGYEITVITAIPDYPQGKFYDGYSLFKRRKEVINGVRVIRLPIIPRGKGKKIELILNYISYFVSAFIFTFFHVYTDKYDEVFVHLTSPFFIGLPAVMLKRRQHIPLIFWMLDLWPESLIAWGGITNKLILKYNLKLVQYVYNNCTKILIPSEGFGESICEKGEYKDKLIYFPNWAESILPSQDISQYKKLQPFADTIKNKLIVLFAGNIGEAQNLDCIITVASDLNDNKNIKFVFLGEGRRKEQLIEKTDKLGLSQTVFFLGHYPLNTMPIFMEMADVLLVSLKDELISNFTIPQKVQFYMSQGKPILAMLNGDGANLINTACCGIVVSPNDSIVLKSAIQKLYNTPKEKLQVLGMNGKLYYEQNFRKEKRLDQLDGLFQSLVP